MTNSAMRQLPMNNLVTTDVVDDDAKLSEVAMLWQKVYVDEFGWLDNADPGGDAYHDRSHYYLAKYSGRPVGTVRIVRSRYADLHITESTNVPFLDDRSTKIAEVQRLMVAPEYRNIKLPGAPFGVYGCMVKATFYHALMHDLDIVIADCHKRAKVSPYKSMRKMGFVDTGASYVDPMNSEDCYILAIMVRDRVKGMLSGKGGFFEYVTTRDEAMTWQLK